MTQNPRIIIVDDEAPAREMVGDYLKMHGFNVTLCDGGKSLRGAIESSVPDLVVLDLNMPDMHGMEVIGFVRSHQAYRNIPIVVLTTKGEETSRTEALAAGANRYLTKPFDPRQLADVVGSLLQTN